MKIQTSIEYILNRTALIVLIVILALNLFGILGQTELIAAFMLYIISNQIILERILGLRKFQFEEVALKYADDLWRFRIGNNVCYMNEEAARDVQEYLNQTINPTSDREEDDA